MMGRNHLRRYIAAALLLMRAGCAKTPPPVGGTNPPGQTGAPQPAVDVPTALMERLKGLTPAEALAKSDPWEIPGVAVACTGIPELLACQWGLGYNLMTDGRVLLWREDGVWQSQPYPAEAVQGIGYFVRLERVGDEVVVIMNVAEAMTLGTEQVQVLRIDGGAWRVAWLPPAADWTRGHATVILREDGFTVDTDSFLMPGIFAESNAGDHRPFREEWVREGAGYVRKSVEELPSDYGAIVHFVTALVKGDESEALRWAAGHDVVKQARELGIPGQSAFFTRRESRGIFRLHTNTPSETPQWVISVERRGFDWVVASVGKETAGRIPEMVHGAVESAPPLGSARFSVSFADEQVGWLASEKLLRVTANGGRTWQDLHTFDEIIYGMQMVSRRVGWVGTNRGLFKTTDGGKTWVSLTDDGFLYGAFQFTDEQTGWKRVYQQGFFRTTDGGKTWGALPDGPCDGAFAFVSPQTGWMVCATGGGAGIEAKDIYRTDDGAQTWLRVATDGGWPGQGGNLPLGSYLSSFVFLDEDHGWLGEAKGGLLVTHDGGETWERLPPTGEVNGNLHFFTPERGIAVLTQHYQEVSTLVTTTDGGQTWTPVYPVAPADPTSAKWVAGGGFWAALGTVANPSAVLMREADQHGWRVVGALPELPRSYFPRSISFIDRKNGWAAADGYEDERQVTRLYRTYNGGVTWTEIAAHQGVRFSWMDFVDEQTGYVGNFQGPLEVTRDGGRTFEFLGVSGTSLRFVSPNLGWMIDGTGIKATSNGGETWTALTPLPQTPIAFDLLPDGTAWVLAGHPTDPWLYATADGGKTWRQFTLGDIRPMKVKAGPGGQAWVWDNINRQFYTEDGGRTWRGVSLP